MKNQKNLRINLFFEDNSKRLELRSSKLERLSYQGPEIKNKDLSKGKYVSAVIHMYQEIKTEKFIKAKCKNYPYKTFQNYSECDRSFVYEQILSYTYNSYMPFWATKDLTEVTNIR